MDGHGVAETLAVQQFSSGEVRGGGVQLRAAGAHDEALGRDVEREEVERVVHSLLAAAEGAPRLQRVPHLRESVVAVRGGRLQGVVKLAEARSDLGVHGALAGEVLREGVAVGAERFADLEDLLAGALAGEEDDEDGLEDLLAGGGVLNLALNRGLLEEHVAPRGAEQHALEHLSLLSRDHAGHEAQADVRALGGAVVLGEEGRGARAPCGGARRAVVRRETGAGARSVEEAPSLLEHQLQLSELAARLQ